VSANFEWPKDTDEELVNNFLKINAPSMLLAYIRPAVSQSVNWFDEIWNTANTIY